MLLLEPLEIPFGVPLGVPRVALRLLCSPGRIGACVGLLQVGRCALGRFTGALEAATNSCRWKQLMREKDCWIGLETTRFDWLIGLGIVGNWERAALRSLYYCTK